MKEFALRQVIYQPGETGFEPRERGVEVSDGYAVSDEVDHDELQARIKEANDNYQVTQDAQGYAHEMTLMNADKAGRGILLRPSTSFSGVLKNPAWMLESALLATLYPNVAHLSWTSFGNSPTDGVNRDDRKYLRHSGRYTKGTGTEDDPYRAVDSIKRTIDMFASQERLPTHFIADQEAARLVLPMMVELEADSVRGASLNGLDGLVKGANYVASPFLEDMQSRVRRHNIGDGKTGEATPVNLKELKRNMPNVYHGWRYIAHLAPLPLAIFARDLDDKWATIQGYRKHNDLTDLADHAVYHDMSAALRQQSAPITLQMNEKSGQHRDIEGCIQFGKFVMDSIPEELFASDGDERGVKLLISKEGTWSQNTDSPYETAAIRKLGLPGIARLSLLMGGLVLPRAENGDASAQAAL